MAEGKMKRMAVAIALAGSTIVAGIVPAAAGETKVGTCPPSFVEIPTSTYPNQGPALDKNGDGKLCQKPLPGVGNEGFFNAIDNMALAGPWEGGCPENDSDANQWERVTVQSLVDQGLIISGAGSVDLNGNGYTCVMFPPGNGVPAGIPTIRDDTRPPSSP